MKGINENVIIKSRIFPCDIDTLWWKWTCEEGIESFLKRDSKIELRINGPFEIYFIPENPPGLKGGEGNKILSYLPGEMLSFSWNAPPEFPEIRNHLHRTWVVLNFIKMGKNQTKLELNHLGWLDDEYWEVVYQYFIRAWDIVFDRLESDCEER